MLGLSALSVTLAAQLPSLRATRGQHACRAGLTPCALRLSAFGHAFQGSGAYRHTSIILSALQCLKNIACSPPIAL
ncbi:hypothetical protein BDV93DRAFT_529015 [Ceratobasidium sp. AG-I]|nr:hypothetical protein BDV93DRAFT_529015 [Ceratobasidium sp. AG-I]